MSESLDQKLKRILEHDNDVTMRLREVQYERDVLLTFHHVAWDDSDEPRRICALGGYACPCLNFKRHDSIV